MAELTSLLFAFYLTPSVSAVDAVPSHPLPRGSCLDPTTLPTCDIVYFQIQVVWMGNDTHRLRHLNTRSPVGGAV